MGNIIELKQTYENCLEVQKEVIAKTRVKLRRAEKEFNFDEMRRLRYALNILYDEKNELENLYISLQEYA